MCNTCLYFRSSLAEGGTLLPQEICVMGHLLQSDWLMQVSHVLNNSHTCGYDIARFINTYQVCTISAFTIVNDNENKHQ